MGRDKALLPWGETDLLGHALARLRRVTDDVRILCGPSPRYADRGVPLVVDRLADAGPVAGVAAGLEECGVRPGLFVAVDLPLVPVALLDRLAGARRVRGTPWCPSRRAGPSPCAPSTPRPASDPSSGGSRRASCG